MTYPIAIRVYIRMRDTSTRAAIDHTMESGHPDRIPCIVNPVACTVRSLGFGTTRIVHLNPSALAAVEVSP